MTYRDPLVSFLVLDFRKPVETRLLLNSLRERVKFPHKVIYLHNGESDYAYDLFKAGLIDQFIQTRRNHGLGVGTRDLFAACFSRWAIYVQNDQILVRDFTPELLDYHIRAIGATLSGAGVVASVSLAGQTCGPGEYSERAHLIDSNFYRVLEAQGLPNHGAGPYHDGEWREAAIQRYYREHKLIHLTNLPPLFLDNGQEAIRENPDGSVWRHYPDTKALWLVSGPIKERHVYPKLSEPEWARTIETQSWPDGAIPELENNPRDSFHHWH